MTDAEGEEPPTRRYAVRFLPRANRESVEAALRLEQITGSEQIGRAWYDGLKAAVGTLATHPRRFAVLARESRLFGLDTRRLLYRRTKTSQAAYHLYYAVEDEGSDDGPVVNILYVRHAAQRPLTAQEAREMQSER